MNILTKTILFLALINYALFAQNNGKITGFVKDSEKKVHIPQVYMLCVYIARKYKPVIGLFLTFLVKF